MLNLAQVFQLAKHRLNQRSVIEQRLIDRLKWFGFHIAPRLSNQGRIAVFCQPYA